MKKSLISLAIFSATISTNVSAALINSASDPLLAGGTVVDFESLPVGNIANGSTLNLGPISIISNRTHLNVQDNSLGHYPSVVGNRFINFYNNNISEYDEATDQDIIVYNPLKIVFNQATKAFGFNVINDCSSMSIIAYNMANQILETQYYDYNSTRNPNDPSATPDFNYFMGIASTQNIAYVLIATEGLQQALSTGYIDNVTLASTSAVPVPAALPLMASALGMFGISRKKHVLA